MTLHEVSHIIIFNKNKIIKATFISVIALLFILVLIYPRTYYSTVSIMPPEKAAGLGGLGALIGGADVSTLLNSGSPTANSQMYIEIVKSRTAAEYVVKKLNLIDYFDAEDLYEATELLSEKLMVDLTKEGMVKISVEVETPLLPFFLGDIEGSKKMAAVLANTYAEALDKINREKMSSKAKNARVYLEEQLNLTKTKMDSVEFALMTFQQKNKTISLPEQLKAVIEGAAKLKTEILETEVQLGLLRTNLREDNKTLIGLREKLSSLQKQYDQMEIGNQDFLLAFKDVPELGREMATLLRDVKIQNEVYLILQQQYYKEKIQENRDTPTLEVLDNAIPPKKAASPRIVYSSVFGGIFIFLFISLFFVLSEKKILKLKRK